MEFNVLMKYSNTIPLSVGLLWDFSFIPIYNLLLIIIHVLPI